jgi:hypothetical protein
MKTANKQKVVEITFIIILIIAVIAAVAPFLLKNILSPDTNMLIFGASMILFASSFAVVLFDDNN